MLTKIQTEMTMARTKNNGANYRHKSPKTQIQTI